MTPEHQENKGNEPSSRFVFIGICGTHGEILRTNIVNVVVNGLEYHVRANIRHGEKTCKGIDILVDDSLYTEEEYKKKIADSDRNPEDYSIDA
jgi:hypothetical protein